MKKEVFIRSAILIAIGIIGLVGLILIEKGVISDRPWTEKVPDLKGMRLDKAAIMMYSSAGKSREPRLAFVEYEEGKSPENCKPANVNKERLEYYTVMDTYPEAGTKYRPGKDTLYLAVEEHNVCVCDATLNLQKCRFVLNIHCKSADNAAICVAKVSFKSYNNCEMLQCNGLTWIKDDNEYNRTEI